MNDDALDPTTPSPELEAVAAVLDGTATPAERALVEASPELQALLADLTADRAAIADLADIEITTEVREWSIAAALGAYDEMLAAPVAAAVAATTPAGATVVRFERRRTAYRAVMGAAAAIVLVLVGVAVIGSGGSDDDQTVTPMAATAKSQASAPDSALAATAAEGGMAAEPVADATTEAAGSAVPNAATDSTSPASPAYTIGAGGATVGSDLQSPQDLVDFAMGRSAMVPVEGEAFPCVADGAEAIGTATYQGADAMIVRDPATGQITAFDLTTCAPLAQAGP